MLLYHLIHLIIHRASKVKNVIFKWLQLKTVFLKKIVVYWKCYCILSHMIHSVRFQVHNNNEFASLKRRCILWSYDRFVSNINISCKVVFIDEPICISLHYFFAVSHYSNLRTRNQRFDGELYSLFTLSLTEILAIIFSR